MTVAEYVLSLRHQVSQKAAELHALQHQLMLAERQHREEAMRALASTGVPSGMVLEQGEIPATAHGGFPTSRTDIMGDQSIGVTMRGSVQLVPDAPTIFSVPRSTQVADPPALGTGENGKGPALVELFG